MNSYIEMKLQVAMVHEWFITEINSLGFQRGIILSHWLEYFPTYNINFTWKSLPHESYV